MSSISLFFQKNKNKNPEIKLPHKKTEIKINKQKTNKSKNDSLQRKTKEKVHKNNI